MRKTVLTLVAIALMATVPKPAFAAGPGRKIDADPSKKYRLSKRHGPWMIMVASMRDVPEERRTKTGLTAQQAADQMVLALRQVGIPAYTFSQHQVIDQVKIANRRTGEKVERSYVAQQDRVVVVAGNYSSAQDKTAQTTLAFVKGTEPEEKLAKVRFRQARAGLDKRLEALLSDPRSGAVYRATPGRPGPMSRAFLMPNPLLNADQLRSATRDPLLVNLNKDMEHSLVACPKKYSLVIRTFRGKSNMHVNKAHLKKSAGQLDSKFGTTLDNAAMDAWRMTEALRNAKSLGYDQDFEAYVYHDRHQSIVTLGSFDSPKDPRIPMLAKRFGGKTRPHPQTGVDMLTAEIFSVPRYPKNGLPEFSWIFDPQPELIERPTLR